MRMIRWSDCGIQGLLRVTPEGQRGFASPLSTGKEVDAVSARSRRSYGRPECAAGRLSCPAFAGSLKGRELVC